MNWLINSSSPHWPRRIIYHTKLRWEAYIILFNYSWLVFSLSFKWTQINYCALLLFKPMLGRWFIKWRLMFFYWITSAHFMSAINSLIFNWLARKITMVFFAMPKRRIISGSLKIHQVSLKWCGGWFFFSKRRARFFKNIDGRKKLLRHSYLTGGIAQW